MKPQLTYYDLAPGVTAFSTTRHGGVSRGSYGEFNVNSYCGDAPEAVSQNRRLLCDELGITPDHLVIPHQVHGTRVCEVSKHFPRLVPKAKALMLEGVDAVMTDEPGLCIGVSTADCTPIIIYDPENHAACAVHAGWRGTLARIALLSVMEMVRSYGSHPEQLLAVVGPGISLQHFEVGDEVWQAFADAHFPMEAISERRRKWHIDLPGCNQLQLRSAGLTEAHIHMSGICTYAQPDDYFSARRLGINSGRIFTGIKL